MNEITYDHNNDDLPISMIKRGGGGLDVITNIVNLTQAVVYIVGCMLILTIMMSYLKKMWDGSQLVLQTVDTVGEKTAEFVVDVGEVMSGGVVAVVDETTATLGEIGSDIAMGAESIIENVTELGSTIMDGAISVGNDLGTLGETVGDAGDSLVGAVTNMIPDF